MVGTIELFFQAQLFVSAWTEVSARLNNFQQAFIYISMLMSSSNTIENDQLEFIMLN